MFGHLIFLIVEGSDIFTNKEFKLDKESTSVGFMYVRAMQAPSCFSMNKRPIIKLKLSATDNILEILGWSSLLTFWVFTLANYTIVPDTIPIHYNAAGEADGFGGKDEILTLPLIATVLFIGITILNKFPHIFNYLSEITPENAVKEYTNATRMLRVIKLVIALVFGLITFITIKNSNNGISGLSVWALPLVLGSFLIPVAYFVIKSVKRPPHKES